MIPSRPYFWNVCVNEALEAFLNKRIPSYLLLELHGVSVSLCSKRPVLANTLDARHAHHICKDVVADDVLYKPGDDTTNEG